MRMIRLCDGGDVSGSLATGSGAQDADCRPAWPAEALLQLCGRGQRVWAALHGPCNMLVWWSLRHDGVTGSGHDRHRADGIGAVWSDFACVKRIRRHRGGALAPPRTSGFRGPIWRGRKRGQCPAPAPPYTVKSTLLTSVTVILDRSMPILPDSGHTAMPWCPPEQHARTAKRAGKSRPADAVQLQQTLASLIHPACSLRSDHTSGGRTGPARNQRLVLLQPASPSPPARWEPMSDGGKRFSVCPKRLPRSAYV